MKFTYIYALSHPISKQIRYIGKSNNPKKRLQEHKYSGREVLSYKRNWINSLQKQGLNPELLILDQVLVEEWKYWERYWIEQMIQWGFDLVNHTSGGDGLDKGNQTSFVKGRIPWNAGTAKTKTCQMCFAEYIPKGKFEKSKYCSKRCYGDYRIENHPKTAFKKGRIPWNKEKRYSHKK